MSTDLDLFEALLILKEVVSAQQDAAHRQRRDKLIAEWKAAVAADRQRLNQVMEERARRCAMTRRFS